ncbi:MAG TPA: NAD(P)-dependent oxidoreductase [Bacteroidota bacterium]|nr:NAD(P)-dependent oxidoreductase [Bacteroidota bacterium]
MRVLVTGGSGMVGRYVVEELQNVHDVEVLDLRPPSTDSVRFQHADILDLETLVGVMARYDAVVHLAGIPHPLDNPAETVFRVNVLGTFNVLEAAARNGIPKVVFMSSESTLGFAFSKNRVWPEYVPIDEQHPVRPQDPYGLSKLSGELACASYTRSHGMTTICLRAPWIWIPEERELEIYRELVRNHRAWYKNLWAYIHVFDVAAAVRLALDYEDARSHKVCFISARNNWTALESRKLLAEFYPETTRVGPSFTGACSFISSRKAKEELGFEAEHTSEEFGI